MPNRVIKESICTSEQIDQLTPFEEITFYRLIVNADDYGCFDGREKIIAARLFPLRQINPVEVAAAIDKLVLTGLVKRYEVGGKPYVFMPTWANHQRLRQSKHKYPFPYDAADITDPRKVAASCGETPLDARAHKESESESESESSKEDGGKKPHENDHWFNPTTGESKTFHNGTFMGDDDAFKIQRQCDEVLTAAESAGFPRTEMVRAKLVSLFADHGRDKMLSGIESCAEHSAANIAYLSAVLTGKPKGRKKDATDVHGYEQRDYSDEQKKAVARMMCDNWGDE